MCSCCFNINLEKTCSHTPCVFGGLLGNNQLGVLVCYGRARLMASVLLVTTKADLLENWRAHFFHGSRETVKSCTPICNLGLANRYF